jgi:hypothetical protein
MDEIEMEAWKMEILRMSKSKRWTWQTYVVYLPSDSLKQLGNQCSSEAVSALGVCLLDVYLGGYSLHFSFSLSTKTHANKGKQCDT